MSVSRAHTPPIPPCKPCEAYRGRVGRGCVKCEGVKEPVTQHPTNVPATAASRPGANIARWRIRLHEAGHAVAGYRLANQKVLAVVFDSNHGAAYPDGYEGHVVTVEDAIFIAAGQAAESLAHSYPEPRVEPAAPLATTYPEVAAVLMNQIRAESVSDAVILAQWAIRHVEDRPHRWARNYYLLVNKAEAFVREHQQEIVEVAAGLYARGIITLQADAAKE